MKSILLKLTTLLLIFLLIFVIEGCTESEPKGNTEPVIDTHLHGILKSSDKLVATSEIIARIPVPDDISTGIQGGYTDGIYQYQFFIKKDEDSNERDNIVRLVKYDIEKQETVAVSEQLYLNHANDLTYNSKERVFYAANCSYDGTIVSKISPETLEVIEKVKIPMSIYCISYNETRDCYVVGINGGQNFRILNSDFTTKGPLHIASTLTAGYTTQGVGSDDEYIYFLLYKENVIAVYDWDGNFISLIYLGMMGEEPENISVVGEDIYVVTSADGDAAIRKLTSIEKLVVSPIRNQENESTPAVDSGEYLTDYISADRVLTYLTLDGTEADAMGKVKTTVNNTISYISGYYGEAASVDAGYISVHDYAPANSSFTVSFWMKTSGTTGDPSIISNKDWDSSKNPGFVLALKHNSILFNLGSDAGSENLKTYYQLPFDYDCGWMHIILSVNREAGTVGLAYDFNNFITADIPDDLQNVSLNAFNVLNIGQDGTGKYPDHLPAALDEVIIFDGAFTQEDVSALAGYYGIT